jgi:hypothetical protein
LWLRDVSRGEEMDLATTTTTTTTTTTISSGSGNDAPPCVALSCGA